MLMLAFMINYLVAPVKVHAANQSPTEMQLDGKFSFWAVLRHFDIWTCAMCHAISLLCLTFKEPILALKLSEFSLSVTVVGFIFSLDTISYTLTSMALQCVKEEANGKKYGRLQYFGLLVFTLSMICSGPIPLLPDYLGIICVGIALGGIGGSLINNNSNAAMMHTESNEAVLAQGSPLTESQK